MRVTLKKAAGLIQELFGCLPRYLWLHDVHLLRRLDASRASQIGSSLITAVFFQQQQAFFILQSASVTR